MINNPYKDKNKNDKVAVNKVLFCDAFNDDNLDALIPKKRFFINKIVKVKGNVSPH